MKAILHPYQERAKEFLKETPHCALLLDMGLGKSLITLTAVSELIDNLELGKVLVVAPLKVAQSTWTTECEKWDHLNHLRVERVLGDERHRIEALSRNADIYVLGRDSFVWLVNHYKARMPFDMIVLDELTSFKSPKSQRFKAFRLIRSQPSRIVGLTGTPAPNGYLDLWAQFYCLDGGERLERFVTRYKDKYFNQVMSRFGYAVKTELKSGAKERIDEKISDISIAMKAEDYLSLPDRSDIVQYVELPESILKRYYKFERDMVLSLDDSQGVTASSAAALMNKLAQFSNGAIYNDDGAVSEIHSEKLQALLEIYEQAMDHVLVFYQYKHDIPRIVEAFTSKKGGPRVVVYKDENDLKDWNEGKIDILLAHPASTAFGLNMQHGGHTVVWFGTGWNLELYQQANARLYRQGQMHPVMVYNLICKGTVDQRAMSVLQGKADRQEALMTAIKDLQSKYKK